MVIGRDCLFLAKGTDHMFEGLSQAFQVSLGFDSVMFMIIGGAFGLVFGALPGLGGTTALALLIPFSYGMEPMVAMLMFGSAMGAVPFGGSVSAIMLNTPGTPQNIATCFDGCPLAQKGKAGLALGASLTASPLGTIVGLVVLAVLIPGIGTRFNGFDTLKTARIVVELGAGVW